jgi:hypothetical protein
LFLFQRNCFRCLSTKTHSEQISDQSQTNTLSS